MTAPRGIRNNNPGNIRKSNNKWQGLAKEQPDSAFATFVDPSMGIRALAVTLTTYYDRYNLNTVRGIIGRWAPPNENDTNAYVNAVCKQTGFQRDQILDLHTYEHMCPLVEAIIRHESGKGPMDTPNTWYKQSVIDVGLQKAGIVKPVPAVAATVPVTTETVAATGSAVVGVGSIADVAPQVLSVIQGQESHLTSGSWVRVGLGVVSIGMAILIAWSQVKKFQQGVVA